MRRRSKQVAVAHPMDGMRSMWEFVFISQFLRSFQDKFGFVHFEVEELENAFLEAENYPLFSVFAKLLRFLLGREVYRMSDWEAALKNELEERGADPNPLDDGSYAEIAADDRVLLLKYIIDYICDGDDEKFNEIKEFKEDFLNPESKKRKPIGQDAQGFVYWYFDDLRLYREKTTRKGTKKSWATVCTTIEDWQNIIKSLPNNKESDKKLYDYLQDELYPAIEPLLKEHEKEKDLKNKKKKTKSTKSKKDLTKEEERDALIKQEEEEVERMKQEEESEKMRNIENQHRKKGRRKKIEMEQEPTSPEVNDDRAKEYEQEQKEIERRIADEIEKEESLISPEDIESGLVPRTRRKCVIMREQTKKKKEWWDEEGIGSDLEDDDDLDSDGSDGPRRRKKKPKLMRPAEPPGPQTRTYIFSTAMANRAAEAVQQGRVESIISFHRAQQTTSPFLRLEQERTFDKGYDQQKAYFSQGFQQPGMGGMRQRGFGRIPGMHPDGNPGAGGRQGYNPAQWQQFQMQQQYMKERQPRQPGVDDLGQILFGGAMNGNGQNQPGTGSYPQRPSMPGQQYSYPQRMASQQPAYQDNRVQEGYRPQFQQGYTQQQQYFQRPRNLPQLNSPGGQSPSSDPLGANVRSPPPPYPGGRPGDSRPQHPLGNSPAAVPSPTSTGSPQTPLTPHAPRFPGTAPSPGEPSKPPFSPTNPQQSNYSAGSFPGAKRPSSESSGSEAGGYQNVPTSQPQGFGGIVGFSQSPMENRQRSDSTQDGSIQSPTEQHSMVSNKSPFLSASTNQVISSASASMPKSFSVESLTAPSAPSDQPGHPLAPEQQMGPYSGIYYQSKYQPPAMYGGQRYQYPSTIQHSGAFYNSQLPSNMYLDRGSMPVYPPGREPGL